MTTVDLLIASDAERAVYGALTRSGVGFIFQSSQLGGRAHRGGAILDFYIPSLMLGINVQSYWHYNFPERLAQDRLQQAALEGRGIRMIYIDRVDVLRDADYYVAEALQFRDHSLMTRGR